MDPNAWNFNPQAYGRLPPGAMAGNPRLDVIDQAAVAAGLAPGLQALSPPLPAHSNLQPTLGYSLQSSLSQIMDSINYGGYKSVPVGQPAFTLETPSPRTVTDHSSLRYPPVSSSASTVKSMFDTDPHTMRETAQSSGFSSALPVSATEPTLSWSLSNFLPGPTPTTTPYVGIHGETSRANSYGNSQSSVSLPEPPPAHSGPRTTKHSAMSRNPYQGRHDFHPHPHTQAHQAKPAHSQFSIDHSLQDLLERERSVHSQHRSVSHSHYEHQTSQRTQNSRSVYQSAHQSAPPPSQQTGRPPSNQSTYSDSGRSSQNHTGYQNTSSVQQRNYRNSSQIQPPRSHAIPPFNNYEPGLSSPGFSSVSNTTSNGNSRALDNSMSYEAVSPATPSMSDSSTIDASAINTTMSLQDFADISASQEKMPLQERVLHNSGQLQRSPHLTNTLQDVSPAHQQSPMQPSPISATGSPQVPMSSMGSPPGNISSSVPPPKIPVQAIADSTTKPKKRSKKKKAPPSIRQLAPPGSQQEMIAAAMREAHFEQNTFSSNTYMSNHANAMTQNYDQQQSIENTSNTNTDFLVAQTQSVLDQFDPVKTTPMGEPIFMTNVFGNEFVNPNEPEFPHISEAGGDNLMNHAVLESDNRLKQRTKAEQKQMPTMTVQSDLDEEFAHLSEGPNGVGKQSHLNGHSNQGNFDSSHSRCNPHDSPITDPNIPHPGNPNPNPKPQGSSGFQGSFLSFLQGKKPETLSSVTNSTVIKKPELPKYIPEPPRPRPPPRPPSPKSKSQSSTNFSDDDDSGKEEINKTVASVISNLTEPVAGDSKTSPPIRMKIKLKGLISQPLSKKSRSKNKGSKSKSKRYSVEEYPTVVIDDEAEAIPRRQTSSRKAKEKVEEKRKKRQKKKKRKSRSVSDESSIELSESDENYVHLSTESEKEYDSDRDPAWNPFGEPVKRAASSDEEDGPGKKGKQTFKKMRMAAKPGVRRGSKQSVDEEEPPAPPPAEPKTVLAHPIENEAEETDPNQIHSFKRGDFVLEKKDLTKYQEFPIWKIDAGRLLQKYEPFMKDGKLTHKSLSTYSSWSDAVKESFQPIKVNMVMCSKGTEFVEVQEQFLPKKPPSEGEENHPLTDSFYIYMQILLSQSLAPGFMKTIKDENESYYVEPLEKIDQMIEEKTQLIHTKVKWLPKFKESLDSHPFIHVIDMPHPTSECQATSEANQSALKVIQLHGEKYDRESLSQGDSQMQEEFKIGPLAAQYVEIYHGLKHFKYCLYKKCLAQVAALQESKGPTKSHDILDQCLQNKNWVLAILKNLDELLNKSESGS